ncbi:MAG: helicase HerA-like domain-containing protein, partial [Chitinophagaceae bacterium]
NDAAERTEEIKKQQKEEKETKTITKKEKGFFDDPVVKSMTRTAGNTIVRSLLGALGLGGRSRRKSLF